MRTVLYFSASLILVIFAYWAYNVNYETQQAVKRVSGLRVEIAQEREAIAVLRAEWAYLNRPDRLRELAETHFVELGLMPMNADHFGDPELVAFPHVEPEYNLQDEIDRLIAEALVVEVRSQ